ncbi:fucose isomerase [Spirochaetia bacterium]|nr:fucose isomerase [Spirochaetia bacterium]
MLKGIDPLISPPLLEALLAMGHGDEIVFADANFPAASHARRIVWYPGFPMLDLLAGVLKLFPLDYAVDFSAVLMQPPAERALKPPIWAEFEGLLKKEKDGDKPFLYLQKKDFYARTREAYIIAATGETRPFSNIILRKGVIN